MRKGAFSQLLRALFENLLLLCLLLASLSGVAQNTRQNAQVAQQYSDKATEYYRQHNYAAALDLYTKAANMGDDGAQTALGHLYAYGQGVSQDYKQAFYWWSEAAQKHNATAEHNLAALYSWGAGVPQNYNRHADWLAQSAKDGNVQAMYEFGRLLSKPIMFPMPDKRGALYWLGEAAKRGHKGAAQLSGELTAQWAAQEGSGYDESQGTPLQAADASCAPRRVAGVVVGHPCSLHAGEPAGMVACNRYHRCVNDWLRAHGYAVP